MNATSVNSVFIMKYSPTGVPLMFTWIAGTGNCQGQGIAIDPISSNLYVTGIYTSTTNVLVSNLALNSNLVYAGYVLPPASAGGAFLLNYSAITGNINSYTVLLGSSQHFGTGVDVDNGSNVIATGYYVNTTTTTPLYNLALSNVLQNTGYVLPIASVQNPYLIRFSPGGSVINYMTLPCSVASQGLAVANAASNVYFSGFYNSASSVFVNPLATTVSLPATTVAGSFTTKYNFNNTSNALSLTNVVGSAACQGQAVAYDAGSNIYVTGFYSSAGTCNVSIMAYNSNVIISTYTLPTTFGQNAVYIIKYNPSGSPLMFTSLIGTGACQGLGIALDRGSNLYVTGYYTSSGPVQVANLALSSTLINSGFLLPGAAAGGAFLLSYSSITGNLNSYTAFSGTGIHAGTALACDAGSNVLMSGYYLNANTTPLFNMAGLTASLPLSGYVFPISTVQNPFLMKFAPNGNIQGYTTLPSTAASQGLALANTAASNIYFTGYYTSTAGVLVSPLVTTVSLPSTNATTMSFTTKYNFNTPSNALALTNLVGTGACQGQAVTYDAGSNIYVTGYYTSIGTCNVALMAYNSNVINSGYTLPATSGQNAVYIVKYDPSGNPLLFTSMIGSGVCQGLGVTLDAGSNLHVTGYYTSAGTVQVSNLALNSTLVNSGFTLPLSTTGAAFFLKYSSTSGNIISFTNLSGTGLCYGTAAAADSGSNIYFTGSYINSGTSQVSNLALNSTMVNSGYTLPAAAAGGSFLLNYSTATGNINSFNSHVGSGLFVGTGLDVDSGSNVLMSGYYVNTNTTLLSNLALSSTRVFSPYVLPISTVQNPFFIKFLPSGTIQNYTTLPSTAASQGLATANAVSNAWFTGYYNSSSIVPVNPMTTQISLPPISGGITSFNAKYNFNTPSNALSVNNLVCTNASQTFAVTSDAGSNIYVTGYYSSSGTCNVTIMNYNSNVINSGYTLPAVSGPPNSVFIMKYSPSGAPLLFTNLAGTSSCYGWGVSLDAGSNLYVTGYYTSSGTVQVSNLALSSTMVNSGFTLPAASAGAYFILKYSSTSGNLISFTNLSGSGFIQGSAISCDSGSNVYVTGYYTATATSAVSNLALSSTMVNSGFTLPASTPSSGVFTIKYAPSGNTAIFTNLVGTGACQGLGIALDQGSNLFVTGYYTSSGAVQVSNLALSSTMVNSGYTLPAAANGGAFLLNYNSVSGNINSFTSFFGSGLHAGNGLTCDPGSNVLMAGYYLNASTTLLSNLALNSALQFTPYMFPVSTVQNPFMVRFSPNGSILNYTTFLGTAAGQGLGVASTSSANAYFTGYYTSTTSTFVNPLATIVGFPLSGAVAGSATVKHSLSSTNNTLAITNVLGTGACQGQAVTYDAGSNIYVTGYYTSTGTSNVALMTYNSNVINSGYTLTATAGQNAVYIAKYSPTGTPLLFTSYIGTGACQGLGIAVDSGSNLYVTGYYTSSGAVQVSNLAQSSTLVNSGFALPIAATGAAFLLNYNSVSGNINSFTAFQGSGIHVGTGLTCDAGSNVLMTGYYTNTTTSPLYHLALNTTLANSGYVLPAATVSNPFFIRFLPSGIIQNYMTLPCSAASQGLAVANTFTSNSYLTGYYNSGSVVFVNPLTTTVSLPAASSMGHFITKHSLRQTNNALSFTSLTPTGQTFPQGVALDAGSNVYVTGAYISIAAANVCIMNYNSNVINSGYTLPVSTPGQFGVYIMKYDPSGNPLLFTNLVGTGDCRGWGVAADAGSNLYVSGYYTSTTPVQISNLALSSTLVNSGYTLPPTSGQNAAFLLNYNAVTGNINSFTSLLGSGACASFNLAIDPGSNVYYCGYYTNTISTTLLSNLALNSSLQYSPYTLPLFTTASAFLIKYTPSGNLSSYTTLSGTATCVAYGLLATASNVYLSGSYVNSGPSTNVNNLALISNLQPSGQFLPTSATQAGYFINYQMNGNVASFTNYTGTGACEGRAIVVDAGSNIYHSGYYTSTGTPQVNHLAFSSVSITSGFTLPANNQNTGFLVKYLPNGNVASFTNMQGTGQTFGFAITADAGSNVFMTGLYTNTGTTQINNLALNPTAQTSGNVFAASSTGGHFTVIYNPTGNVIGFTNTAGTGQSAGRGIVVDAGSNIITVGSYQSTANVLLSNIVPFNVVGKGGFNLPASGQNAMYLIGYNAQGIPTGFTNLAGSGACLGQGVAVDGLSNVVYVTGYYTNTGISLLSNIAPLPFGTILPSPFSLPASAQNGAYIIKYSNVGNVVAFTNLTGSGACQGYGLAVDAGSNVIFTGQYINTATTQINILGQHPTPQNSLSLLAASTAGSAVTIAYSPTGAVLQYSNLPTGTGASSYRAVTVDPGSNIYTTGSYISTANVAVNILGLSNSFASSSGQNAQFMVAYSPTGSVLGLTNLIGTGSCIGRAVNVDAGSNIIPVGAYTSTSNVLLSNLVPFTVPGYGGYFLPVSAQNATFLAGYGPSGSVLGTTSMSGTGACQGFALASDAGSNVFLTGQYINTGNTIINNLAANSAFQISGNVFAAASAGGEFMVAYGPTGNVIGFNNFLGTGLCTSRGITVDTGSNIYTTGSYTSTSNVLLSNLIPFVINNRGLSLPISSGQNAIFLIGYTPTGNVFGLTSILGTSSCLGQGVAFDDTANVVYLTGYYTSGTLTLLSNITASPPPYKLSPFTLPISGQNTGLIIKYSNVGNVLSFTNMFGSGSCQGYAITTDAGSNVYLTGQYINSGTTSINNLATNSTPQPSGNVFAASTTAAQFTIVYSPTGNVLGFNNFAGTGACSGRAIAVDPGSNIYTTGTYLSSSNVLLSNLIPFIVSGRGGYTITGTPQNGAFLIGYTPSGNVIGTTMILGTGACVGYGVAADGLSNVYLTGSYTSVSNSIIYNLSANSLPRSTGNTFTSAIGQGMFITKYSNTGSLIGYSNIVGTNACAGLGIIADGNSNISVCGYYTSNTITSVGTIGNPPTQTTNLIYSTFQAPLVITYSPSGAVQSCTTIPMQSQVQIYSGTLPVNYFATVAVDSSANVYSFGTVSQSPFTSNSFIAYSFSNATPYNLTFINPALVAYSTGTTYYSGIYPMTASAAIKLGPSGVVAPPVQLTFQTPPSPSLISLKKLYNTGVTPLQVYVNNIQTTVNTKQTWEWVNSNWIRTQ